MNPFGTQASIPFLFGEDPVSQQAQESFQAAGDVAQKLIGLKDPRSPEAIASADPIYGGAGPLEAFLPGGILTKTPKILGGLQKLSRFKPSATPSQLPVLRGGQQPKVLGGNQLSSTVTTPPSTFLRGGGPKRVEGTVINPLTIPQKSGSNVLPSLATLGLGSCIN